MAKDRKLTIPENDITARDFLIPGNPSPTKEIISSDTEIRYSDGSVERTSYKRHG